VKTFIAQSTLGLCGICQLLLDAGEWVGERENGRQIHLGCVSRMPAIVNEDKKPDQAQPQFSLFGDNELETAIEAKNETVERVKQTLGVRSLVFDGASALAIDLPRLAGQLEKVYELMSDKNWRTLDQIANATGCMPQSASARLRDFRKKKFGGFQVISRPVSTSPLIYEYQLILSREKETDERERAAA
jgi:hypothetical protein